jgi:hypothetical protein
MERRVKTKETTTNRAGRSRQPQRQEGCQVKLVYCIAEGFDEIVTSAGEAGFANVDASSVVRFHAPGQWAAIQVGELGTHEFRGVISEIDGESEPGTFFVTATNEDRDDFEFDGHGAQSEYRKDREVVIRYWIQERASGGQNLGVLEIWLG